MEKVKKEVKKEEVLVKEVKKELPKKEVKEALKATGKFECVCKEANKCKLVGPDARILSPEMSEVKVKDMVKKFNK